jgi:hypothetical protein
MIANENCVSEAAFDNGKTACLYPGDIDQQDPYTLRLKLPFDERTEETTAKDELVNIISVADREVYFDVLTAYLGSVVVYKVAHDGIIVGSDPTDPELGYFLSGELRSKDDAKLSEECVKVPMQPKKAAPLKALTWPPQDDL